MFLSFGVKGGGKEILKDLWVCIYVWNLVSKSPVLGIQKLKNEK